MPHADAVAQQADTGLHQLCIGLHGKSQRYRLKDDCMLGFVLGLVLGVFGHLVVYKNDSMHELCCC